MLIHNVWCCILANCLLTILHHLQFVYINCTQQQCNHRFRLVSGGSWIFASTSNTFGLLSGNRFRYLLSGTGLRCWPGLIAPVRFSSFSFKNFMYDSVLESRIAVISVWQNCWLKSFCANLVIKFCISWRAGAVPPCTFFVHTRSLTANGNRGFANGTLYGFCGRLEPLVHSIWKIRMAKIRF